VLIGYARVSTMEQDTHLQRQALERAGVDRIFEEKRSGSTMAQRVQLQALLEQLRPGDVVVVYKLDRLARSLADLLRILARIEGAGAGFKSLTETLDTISPAGRMLMQLLGAFAEFERAMIVERTNAGLSAAKSRGVQLGRPAALSPSEARRAREQYEGGAATMSGLARLYGCNVSSVKRAIARDRAARV
jgi:DNA invertase Pin-like site-specific DNA recombinase